MVNKLTESKLIELFLSDYSKRVYLREAAKLINKPHQTIKPYLTSLVKKGILIETRHGSLLEYSLNFKDKSVYDYMTISEKEKTQYFLNSNILLKLLYEKLNPFFKKNTFILFGSVIKQSKTYNDVDILQVGSQSLKKEIAEIEEVYSKKIHLIQIHSLKGLSEALLKEIYKNHIIFNNTEEIINYFGELHGKNKMV